jgi:hypothetical protein
MQEMGYVHNQAEEKKLVQEAWNLLAENDTVSQANFLTFACSIEGILPGSFIQPNIAKRSDLRPPAGFMIEGELYFSKKEEVMQLARHFRQFKRNRRDARQMRKSKETMIVGKENQFAPQICKRSQRLAQSNKS